MNIELKDVSETRKTLQVSLDKAELDTEHQNVVKEIGKFARIPGFRPGRAPAALILKRFAKEVQEELGQKVVERAYRDGIKEAKLDVMNVVNVDRGTIEPGQPAAVTFTIDVQPQFELPDYNGLPTTIAPTDPSEAEVDALIEGLRNERADFKVADRPAQKGDYVKLAYHGSVDGRPIAEIAPGKQVYGDVPQTWEEVEGADGGLIPGLGAALGRHEGGRQEGRRRHVSDEFRRGARVGRARPRSMRSRSRRSASARCPALDAEFLKTQQVDSLEALRTQVRQSLVRRKEQENRRVQRQQVQDALASKIEFPLPESLIAAETQGVLRRFMEDNIRRGVPEAEFEKNKKELYDNARRAAAGRVKSQLLLAKIAEKEKIQADERDLDRAIMQEALRSGQRPEKVAREFARDRDRLRALQQAIVFDKALDFLVAKSTVTTAVPKV